MATGLSKLLIAVPVALVSGLIGGASTCAQVATDGTAGPRVDLAGPDFEIGADLGTRAGRNLFHSFERFSLGAGERATFSGPDQIRNVISRVTGGARSDIDGTLRSTIPGADFYFLNPAGVVFGPNASLDLQGSFHVSTADELRFADGAKFSATNPAPSSFTVARPEAFGFLGTDPAPITADASVLRVPPGEALSIVGGDLDIAGGVVRAEAGQITLAAAGGPGEVRLGSGAIDAVRRADISLAHRARVNASGAGGGTVRIRGGRLVVEDNSSVTATNTGSTDATVGIDVRAETVMILGDSRLSADAFGSGAGGDVSISANDVRIRGSWISTEFLGSGAGGDVSITANDIKIEVGSNIVSRSDRAVAGDSGTIRIEAGRADIAGRVTGKGAVFVTNISSDVRDGNGGAVIIIAEELIIRDDASISASTFGGGQGGEIIIVARDLDILNESFISSIAFDAGDSGSITITAAKLNIEDSFIDSDTFESTGEAGAVTIEAGELAISGGLISSDTTGPGAAGRVRLTADRMTVTNFAIISSSYSLGLIGEPVSQLGPEFFETAVPISVADVEALIGIDIDVIAVFSSDFFLSLDGRVFVIEPNVFDGEDGVTFLPRGAGIAGDLLLSADELTIDTGSVATDSFVSAGGRIVIEATGLIHLVDANVISDGIRPGEGDSVITLRAPRIAINHSRVMSLTGNGEPLVGSGEARILGDLTVISADSEVAASSTVEITGQEADVGSQLVTLEGVFLDTAPLRARCGARRDIGASSFTGVGRGGLPASPDGPLTSAYIANEALLADAQAARFRPAIAGAPADARLAGFRAPCAPLD